MADGAASLPIDHSVMPAALRHWRWRVFGATWLCYVGFYLCRKPYSIVKSDLGAEMHFSTDDLAIVYATYLVTYTLGQFLSGAIGPRIGPRRMLLGGMAVSIAASIGFGLVDSLPAFVVLMGLNGLAQAAGWSNCVGTMAAWFHRGERGTVMGIWATNFQVGGIASNAVAAWSMAHPLWFSGVLGSMGIGVTLPAFRWAFFSGAFLLAIVWVVVFLFQANRPEDKGLPPVVDPAEDDAGENAPAQAHWDRKVWITVLLVGGAYFGMKFIRYALWSWAPFLLSRNFHMKADDAGYVSTIFDVCGVVGVVATGYLSDKVFHGRRAKVAFLMLIGMVASTVALLTLGQTDVVVFAICIGLVGFTLYGPDALLTGAGAMDIGSKDGAVRAAGIISGLGSAGSVVQELMIGRSYSTSGGAIAPILAMLFGSALFAAACVAVILWRNRQGLSDV